MKKIFNNSGMTFVEVIIAVIILGIISTPILMTLIQTSKLNLKSDVELKVNSKIQQVLEEVKAEGKVNPEYSTTGVYFDRFFESTTDPAQYTYKLVVADPTAETSTNKIDTTAEYDRWDFKLDLKKNVDPTKADVVLYSNTGVRKVQYSGVGDVLGGKLYEKSLIYSTPSSTPTNTFSMKFTGRLKDITSPSYVNYRLNFGLLNFGADQVGVDRVDFIPGYGAIDTTNANNTIVINVTRNEETPLFNLNLENLTFYTKFLDDTNVFQIDSRGNLGYTKHVVLNIFGDNPVDQKVKVVTNSPYVDIFRKATPQIDLVNGQKIQVRVERVNPPAGVEPVVKTIESVVGKEVKVTP